MKQYLKLLMVREAKEVLGKNGANLWLLTIVLVATFTSIAFSEGSMIYLKDKMEDPFTNWVDIDIQDKQNDYNNLRENLESPDIQKRYGFGDVHGDREIYYDMQRDRYLRCRHFANINSPLIKKILSKDNVVNNCVIDTTKLSNKSLGLIVTMESLKAMGYSSESIPSYIYYKAYNPSSDTLGLKLQNDKFLLIPFPVLAVVRRLPGNVDMMSTNYMSEQPSNDNKYPFDFTAHESYISELRYFIQDGIDDETLLLKIKEAFPDSIARHINIIEENLEEMLPWCKGKQIKLDFGAESPNYTTFQWLEVDKKIQKLCSEWMFVRIYNYETGNCKGIPDKYLSLAFQNLDSIRAFEEYVKNNYHIQIDMSQIASKENFNAVTVMAAILSGAMVVFSLICIIMFMINMLQSYFQKVSKNIGTFKAFGMNTQELIQTYEIMLLMIVFSAVIMALMITWGIQGILPIIGIEKEGFNYLSLWNTTTYIAAVVVIVSTIATVSIVMSRMLSRTPGDLIYDRN